MRKVISTKVKQVGGTGYEINVFYQNQKGIKRFFCQRKQKCLEASRIEEKVPRVRKVCTK